MVLSYQPELWVFKLYLERKLMKKITATLTLLLALVAAPLIGNDTPLITKEEPKIQLPQPEGCVSYWSRYRADFRVETVFARFPHDPVVTSGNGMTFIYAYDYDACYTLSGYYPPVVGIDSGLLFDEILYSANEPPFVLLNASTYYASAYGHWVLDFVMHDTYQNMIVKNRTIVTPFNAYSLQTTYPYGSSAAHNYFVDSCYIRR